MHLKVNEEMIFSSGLGKSPWSYSWTRVETTGANECAHWHHSPLFYEYSECLETCAFVSPPPPPSFVPLLFPGTPVLAILLPTDTIFDTEQRKLGFSFESSTTSRFEIYWIGRILMPRSIWLYYSFQFLLIRSMEIGMKRKTFPVGKHPVTSDSWHGVR